jgi:hypothetical protein
MTTYWDIVLRSLIEVNRRFRDAYCPHHESDEALIMETVCTSESSVYFNETIRCYIPERCRLHTHRRENLRTHTL